MGRPPRKPVPLTNKQKRFAEENHNLIYKFLAVNKLDIEDWYDIVAIAFVCAVKAYNPKTGFRLSTYAFPYMWNAVRNERTWQSAKKRTGVTFSLDSRPFGDEEPLYALVPDETNFESKLISRAYAEHWFLQLNAKDREVLLLRMKGMKNYEAARMSNITLGALENRLTRLQRKLVSMPGFSLTELPEL